MPKRSNEMNTCSPKEGDFSRLNHFQQTVCGSSPQGKPPGVSVVLTALLSPQEKLEDTGRCHALKHFIPKQGVF